ncbi:MAG TPA: nuclear transport factor 2 family protein [Thermodesulfobacteriota bacterium]|nr:nuclear transport factor 2 family protein [Thermodesulfobacteriota bacterium]
MTSENKDEVLKANAAFYQALRSGDLKSMSGVWLNEPEAKCVHPGWPMLYGWEAVRESWKNIFKGGPPADIEISDVRVYVSGGLAWVICIEKISQTAGGQTRHGYAQATNVFELRGSSWLLVVHHASPVPMPVGDAVSNHNLQ